MNKLILVIIGLVCLSLASAYAFDDHDFQVWNTDVEEFKVNKDSKLVFEEEFRWGDNARKFYYHHYDIGFFYDMRKFLNIGGGYRQVYELKSGKFKLENEPYLAATLLWDLRGFKFDDRNRLEYRHFDYQTDSWRYRNKVTLKGPWKFTKLQLQPFVADEIFIGFDGASELNQNRFSSGFSMALCQNIKAEIFYMLQSNKSSGKWTDANVLGAKVKITF